MDDVCGNQVHGIIAKTVTLEKKKKSLSCFELN